MKKNALLLLLLAFQPVFSMGCDSDSDSDSNFYIVSLMPKSPSRFGMSVLPSSNLDGILSTKTGLSLLIKDKQDRLNRPRVATSSTVSTSPELLAQSSPARSSSLSPSSSPVYVARVGLASRATSAALHATTSVRYAEFHDQDSGSEEEVSFCCCCFAGRRK